MSLRNPGWSELMLGCAQVNFSLPAGSVPPEAVRLSIRDDCIVFIFLGSLCEWAEEAELG